MKFCSPECACAYLMKENIGDTEKFERYHLLNYIYGEIFNYGHNLSLLTPFYFEKIYG